MSVSDIDVEKLIHWLGHKGAIAGLEGSDFTVAELNDIAVRRGLAVEKRTKRSDIIIDLVNCNSVRIDKTAEELLAMQYEDLRDYFRARRVSRTEIMALLSRFDVRPSYEDKMNLLDFAAREISDFGMYQRVAKGVRGK